jgi:hypothetical protein
VDDEFESPPSHYKELPDVRFDMSVNNKISPAIINHGITVRGFMVIFMEYVLTFCYISYLRQHSKANSLLVISFLSQRLLRLKLTPAQVEVAFPSGSA